MRIYKSHNHDVPGLNTAALPDLIFTVLFFFMIVTHMRQTDVKVRISEPQGTELEQQKADPEVVNIFIGRDGQIQLGNRLGDITEVASFVVAARSSLQPDQQERFAVCLKADKQTPMNVVQQVKRTLREQGVLRIYYAAKER